MGIEHYSSADRLTTLRCPTTSGKHRNIIGACDFEDGLDVADLAGKDYTERLHLIMRRVGRVQAACQTIKADLALNSSREFSFESWISWGGSSQRHLFV